MFNMTEMAEPVDLLLDLHKDVQYAQNKKSHLSSNSHGAEGVQSFKVGAFVTATWKISSNHIQSVLFKTGNNFANMATQTKVLQQLSFVFDEEQQSAISLGQATFFLKSHFVGQ